MKKSPQQLESIIAANAVKTRFDRRESSEAHNSYQMEKRVNEAIRQGDIDTLRTLLDIPEPGTPGKLSKIPLRNKQNLFIAGVTLFTRSAIEGGLPVEEAFNMSDAYISISESASNLTQISELHRKAAFDFTGKVAKIQRKQYAPSIQKTMDFIYKNLHNDFSLEDLAQHVNLSPSYLSRLFRKECGMPLFSYVQKERIHAAQNMLRFSDYSYSDIANYLNFKSQSYFISVFKKYVKMTPLQYRKKHLPGQN